MDALAGLPTGPRVDDVLAEAARRAPDRTALYATGPAGLPKGGRWTYAELDAEASACAAAVRGIAGSGAVVAVASALDPAYPVAFYGIARSGGTSALISPLLRGDGLVHVLRTSGSAVAILTPQAFRNLEPVRDRLPELRQIVLTHRDDDLGPGAEGLPTLWELMARASASPAAPGEPGDADGVACLQFTNGTTGAPKAVRLTHRNLTVNAAQIVHAHELDGSSVLFDQLPTFHLMHLTAAVSAAAALVLCPDDDPVAAVRSAAAHRTTHFYSLPVRLIRLAADPRLTDLEAPSLRALLSGGSTMPPQATTALSQHFGVPVVQGYGLAETSPLVANDVLERPKLRSSGPPVAGTEIRIVDVETRRARPTGEIGEIEVRGPQLMLGYLGRDRGKDLDADGWFATGDIGRVDEDGYLFVVDRIKDVFKRDNWLVSPTEIERVLLRHPGVADCAVVDAPHPLSGAVAHGVVVRADPAVTEADLAAFVADRLPYYEHLDDVEFVDAIPRTANGGKIQRAELRRRIRERAADQGPEPKAQPQTA